MSSELRLSQGISTGSVKYETCEIRFVSSSERTCLTPSTSEDLMYRFIALSVCAALCSPLSPAYAGIIAQSGSVEIVPLPADVRNGQMESNRRIVAFAERQGVSLTSDVPIDIQLPGTSPDSGGQNLSPSIVPTGTAVSSYFVHFDALGEPANGTIVFAEGSLTFNEDILGVIVLSSTLNATHAELGGVGTLYPGGDHQGMELSTAGAYVTLSADRRTLSFGMPVGPYSDNLRVITAVPEASSFALLALGSGAIVLVRCGRNQWRKSNVISDC
jgi:hypothetical protein